MIKNAGPLFIAALKLKKLKKRRERRATAKQEAGDTCIG